MGGSGALWLGELVLGVDRAGDVCFRMRRQDTDEAGRSGAMPPSIENEMLSGG
jgi:hypothetical protein